MVKALAKRTGMTLSDCKLFLDALAVVFREAAEQGHVVKLPGVGQFKPVIRAARSGRNPKTGEPLAIAARNDLKFKPALELRAVL